MWYKHGGSLIIRRSRLAKDFGITNKWHPAMWIPHFLHRDKQLQVTQYAPLPHIKEADKKRGIYKTLLYKWLTLWFFEGHVIGDDESE
jgi:hypothetical protein